MPLQWVAFEVSLLQLFAVGLTSCLPVGIILYSHHLNKLHVLNLCSLFHLPDHDQYLIIISSTVTVCLRERERRREREERERRREREERERRRERERRERRREGEERERRREGEDINTKIHKTLKSMC